MKCKYCGGQVLWDGWNKSIGNWEYTKCQRCGAINSQTKEEGEENNV